MSFSLPTPANLIKSALAQASADLQKSHPHLQEIPPKLDEAGQLLEPVIAALNQEDMRAVLSTVLGHKLSPTQIAAVVQAGALLLHVIQVLAHEFGKKHDAPPAAPAK